MKSCVLTANYPCDTSKVWLYLTKPDLAHWRTDLKSVEVSSDGMQAVQTCNDGSKVQVNYTRKEQNRALSCEYVHGRQRGTFTAILLGGGSASSLECSFTIDGVGPFDKAHKHLQPVLDMLQKVLE